MWTNIIYCIILTIYIVNSNKNFITTGTIDLAANTLVSLNVRDAMTSNNLLSGSMQGGALDEYIKNIITETNSLPNNYDPKNKFGSLLATIVQIASVFITSEKLNGDIENRTEILSRLAAKCGLLLEKKMGIDKENQSAIISQTVTKVYEDMEDIDKVEEPEACTMYAKELISRAKEVGLI